jgi:site-specific recombinase XerD
MTSPISADRPERPVPAPPLAEAPPNRRGRPPRVWTPAERTAKRAEEAARVRAYRQRQGAERQTRRTTRIARLEADQPIGAIDGPSPLAAREALRRDAPELLYLLRDTESVAPIGPRPLSCEEGVGAVNRELISRYLSVRATRLLPATRDAYRADLHAFARVLEPGSIAAATEEDVSRWLAGQIRDPKNPTDAAPWCRRTAKRKLSALNGFYKWALRTRDRPADLEPMVRMSPTVNVEIARIEKRAPARLTPEMTKAFFARIEERILTADDREAALYVLDAAVFRLCYPLGLRASEVANIHNSQFHDRDGMQHVRVVRKGDKVHVFPVLAGVRDAIDRWRTYRGRLTVGRAAAGYLFVHPLTGRRITRKRIWSRFKRIAREAGMAPEAIAMLSPHKLRHTVAYELLDLGYSMAAVQSLLGHSSITTTQDYTWVGESQRLEMLKQVSVQLTTVATDVPAK